MTMLTSSLYPQKPHTLLQPIDVVWPMSRAIWLQGGPLPEPCSEPEFYGVVVNSAWRLAVESSPAHTSNSVGSTTQPLDWGFQYWS